jgi:hypothetical protein
MSFLQPGSRERGGERERERERERGQNQEKVSLMTLPQ